MGIPLQSGATALAAVALLSLHACRAPGLQQAAPDREILGDLATRVPSIHGRVYFPEARKVQATMTDVAQAATVTLIDTSTNASVGTSLTDATGNFSLSFGSNFAPAQRLYYLEAAKGLGAIAAPYRRIQNKVGNDALRVRTVLQYVSGWHALTGSGGVIISRATTAVSALMDLKGLTKEQKDAVMGRLKPSPAVPGGMPDFDPTGLAISAAEYKLGFDLVTTSLAANWDPIHALQYDRGTLFLREGVAAQPPIISDVVPIRAVGGDKVVLYGRYFEQVKTRNLVDFGGVVAVISSVEGGRMVVTVPSGAFSGEVTVTTDKGQGSFPFEVLTTMSGKFLGL